MLYNNPYLSLVVILQVDPASQTLDGQLPFLSSTASRTWAVQVVRLDNHLDHLVALSDFVGLVISYSAGSPWQSPPGVEKELPFVSHFIQISWGPIAAVSLVFTGRSSKTVTRTVF